MVGNMLLDRMVNRLEIKRFEVPWVWHTLWSNNIAPRLVNQEPENSKVPTLSSKNSCSKNIGLVRLKWTLLAKPKISSSTRHSSNASH